MEMSRLTVILVLLGLAGLVLALWLVSNAIIVAAGPTLAVAETTFTGSTVVDVDQAGRQLTVRTVTGDVWTLQVARADLLAGLKKGDRVSLEIDDQERVVRLVKVTDEGSNCVGCQGVT